MSSAPWECRGALRDRHRVRRRCRAALHRADCRGTALAFLESVWFAAAV